MTDEEYYQEFMQNIYARAGSERDFCEQKFVEVACDFLCEQAVLDHYEPAFFKKTNQGIRVDAWRLNLERQTLNLFICDFKPSEKMRVINLSEINKLFGRVEKFFDKVKSETYFKQLEESLPIYSVVQDIKDNIKLITKIKLFIISNAILSSRFRNLNKRSIEGFETIYDVWEMGRFSRISQSKHAKEDIIIDLTKFVKNGIPYLQAHTESSMYKSYLLAFPGQLLAEIYDQYGERLLEQNVRTFLQFRGGVNKGVRNTLKNQPEMFFAFNNGLAVTAEATKTFNNRLLEVKNLQIVNGGQTTASIFMSKLQDKTIDLNKVYVQVKLTVIDSEKVDEIVPIISKCANTQNKVSAADFFSNHPFHKRVEDFSRRTLAPSKSGTLTETYWFYERARGQYANIQAKMTPSRRRQFLVQNPKSQMFTKTDLAKYENSFAQLPHYVSKGAQWNFGKFAEEIGGKTDESKGLWEENELQFNHLYFKHTIAKAIIFRFLDKNLMRQPWYGGYKANIITYTIAKFSYEVAKEGKFINFLKIWNSQCLTTSLENELLELAEQINRIITDTDENVTQYCKKENCWEAVKGYKYLVNSSLDSELIGAEVLLNLKNEAKENQKIINARQAESLILSKDSHYWTKLICWAESQNSFSLEALSVLKSTLRMNVTPPTEKQCAIIMQIIEKAIEEGFFIDA